MELGLTFPLQGFLKRKPPAYGGFQDRRYCWDLHVISLRGSRCLLGVHCHSRYTFVVHHVFPHQWQDLAALFQEGLSASLSAAGFSLEEIRAYLDRGGAPLPVRTHGRREVAFLNRAWEDVMALDHCVDPSRQDQPLLEREVNTRYSRCAGVEGMGTALERMAAVLKEQEEPEACLRKNV